jgi:hypothetical protein
MRTARDANVSLANETRQAAALREAMVGELRELRAIRSDRTLGLRIVDRRGVTAISAGNSAWAWIGGAGKKSMLIAPSFKGEASVWWSQNAGKCGSHPRSDMAGAELRSPGSWRKTHHRPILTDLPQPHRPQDGTP